MKKWYWCYVFLVCLCFMACSSDDDSVPSPSTEPEIDYVVMLYGCGGGNLDAQLMYNLEQAATYGATDKVKMTGIVKYSKIYQNDEEMKGTHFLDLEEDGFKDEQKSIDFKLYDPDNIANFIKDSAKKYPAKKYILVLWNHGGTWTPIDDAPVGSKTRGICFDDNYETLEGENEMRAISIFELAEGMKRSGVKLEVVYWDACLMNMVENLCEIKDYTNYVLGAANLTPSEGGNYAMLLKSLSENPDTEQALKKYIDYAVSLWTSGNDSPQDLTLINMTKFAPIVECMKPIPDVLLSLRNSDDEQIRLAFDYLSSRIPRYDEDRDNNYKGLSVDLLFMLQYLSKNLQSGTLAAYASFLEEAWDNAMVYQKTNMKPEYMSKFSLGVTWVPKFYWEGVGYESVYTYTAFDKVVRWSDFMKTNDTKRVEYDDNLGKFVEVVVND